MPCFSARIGVLLLLLFAQGASASENELSLFDGQGHAIAYIALDDDLTIYLWSGEPVAYLTHDASGSYDVYGFNGSHLGWFQKVVVWDHAGGASCATKEAMQGTQLEPLKSLKQLKPLRSLRELAPLKPLLSNAFGDTPCMQLLGSGAG
jgi:hypothetical protein